MIVLIVILAAFLGAVIGKLIAIIAQHLPEILFEGGEKGREPRHVFNLFFQKPLCTKCQHPLAWIKSIPVFGFLSLKGKCPTCQHPLEKKVFLLELGTALFFALSTLFFTTDLSLVFVLLVSCVMICCFITDFEHGILPDQFTLTLVWIGLVASLQPIFITPSEAIIGAVGGYATLWIFNAIYRFYRGMEGMYPGDFKLNAGIGACLGFKWFLPIMGASLLLLLAITTIQVILCKKKSGGSFLHKEVPYACFASIVTIVALFLRLASK